MKGVKSMTKIQRRPDSRSHGDDDEQNVNSDTWIKPVGWRKYLTLFLFNEKRFCVVGNGAAVTSSCDLTIKYNHHHRFSPCGVIAHFLHTWARSPRRLMNSTGPLKLLFLRNKAMHTGGTSPYRTLARKMFDGAWIAGNSYLDCLKSGGVVVGELLEDVSCSEAKGAQAVQDWRLEAWPKRILNGSALKYKWVQNTSFDLKSQGKTRVPTKANENIINDQATPH